MVSSVLLKDHSLWKKTKKRRIPFAFDIEITARCNNDCSHCYINLPTGDKKARAEELSFEEIKEIASEAISLGAIWCLITGGEPLLREDFVDIYLYLKSKGLMVSIYTNATLITEEHIQLLKKYPPKDVEVTVYGVTKETYERVSRRPGSYAAFRRGLNLLLQNGVKIRLKAMALRSNVHELNEIAHFCRRKTKDYFRFDPFLHLRYDRNPERNERIKSERLSPEEIIAIERSDPERFQVLKKNCNMLIVPEFSDTTDNLMFFCGAGNFSFSISHNSLFHICSSLWHPDCLYDLRKGNLTDAWHNFVPKVRDMRSSRKEFLENCRRCPLINLCLWCPAHAYLEIGHMDAPIDFFCKVANARAKAISGKKFALCNSKLAPR
jgi:radical SAM protein with 4Fe4S-binding SPASM domain